ncbi:TraB/GumN family protein [Falsirhodobacter sp. alg1]|uniref:TraB/GumN family protein n=1 Tax=Falsirhodobacter sp. alg1 TaxID=1472418 RepID=UPI0005ED905F|nr:TraB/GumN family protein [Falsirhodobacter sp. alg1]
MIRTLTALFVLFASPVVAQCSGHNLINAMSASERHALRQQADSHPHARGLLFRATRGDEDVVLMGTYHLDDPRMDALAARVAPMMDNASTLLVEAGPKEQAALEKHFMDDPSSLLVSDGPTLPERLTPSERAQFRAAMAARGIPPRLANRYRPWYVAMLLGMPPCSMGKEQTAGLDQRLMDIATERHVPIRALEPWQTALDISADLPEQEQVTSVRMSLPMEKQADDAAITLADSYFNSEPRLIWEFMQQSTPALPGQTTADVHAEFAKTEKTLLIDRNKAWIPVIENACKDGPVVAAFGALHLSGDQGVLALLEREGFTISRLD